MATSVDSFQVKVYQGDSAVLFAFDVADAERAGHVTGTARGYAVEGDLV